MKLVHGRIGQDLPRSRRPVDGDALHPFAVAEAEVQATIVLTREAHSAIDDATLLRSPRFKDDLGSDRATIAARADEGEGDPVIRTVGPIAIEYSRLILVGNDDVKG